MLRKTNPIPEWMAKQIAIAVETVDKWPPAKREWAKQEWAKGWLDEILNQADAEVKKWPEWMQQPEYRRPVPNETKTDDTV